jgi:hypothetical protein
MCILTAPFRLLNLAQEKERQTKIKKQRLSNHQLRPVLDLNFSSRPLNPHFKLYRTAPVAAATVAFQFNQGQARERVLKTFKAR